MLKIPVCKLLSKIYFLFIKEVNWKRNEDKEQITSKILSILEEFKESLCHKLFIYSNNDK